MLLVNVMDSNWIWSLRQSFSFIYDCLQVATCNKTYRGALERNKFPLLAHVYLSELRVAKPLRIDASMVYLRFPSLSIGNSNTLTTSVKRLLEMTHCMKIEFDFEPIESSCLKTV